MTTQRWYRPQCHLPASQATDRPPLDDPALPASEAPTSLHLTRFPAVPFPPQDPIQVTAVPRKTYIHIYAHVYIFKRGFCLRADVLKRHSERESEKSPPVGRPRFIPSPPVSSWISGTHAHAPRVMFETPDRTQPRGGHVGVQRPNHSAACWSQGTIHFYLFYCGTGHRMGRSLSVMCSIRDTEREVIVGDVQHTASAVQPSPPLTSRTRSSPQRDGATNTPASRSACPPPICPSLWSCQLGTLPAVEGVRGAPIPGLLLSVVVSGFAPTETQDEARLSGRDRAEVAPARLVSDVSRQGVSSALTRLLQSL